jgi:hypothetical protein
MVYPPNYAFMEQGTTPNISPLLPPPPYPYPYLSKPTPATRVGVLAGQVRVGFYAFNGFKRPAPGSEDIRQKYIVKNICETNLN